MAGLFGVTSSSQHEFELHNPALCEELAWCLLPSTIGSARRSSANGCTAITFSVVTLRNRCLNRIVNWPGFFRKAWRSLRNFPKKRPERSSPCAEFEGGQRNESNSLCSNLRLDSFPL